MNPPVTCRLPPPTPLVCRVHPTRVKSQLQRRGRPPARPGLWAAVTLAFGVQSAAAAADPFTVVVLPDTQYYTQTETNNTRYFKGQTGWIATNQSARNIAFVLHLGDIQNDGNPYYARTDDIYQPDLTRPTGLVPDDAQFRRADAAIDLLDAAGVPYSLLAGNHDFVDHTIKDEPIYYLKWFGPQRYAGKPTFGGASPATPTTKWAGMNTWHTFDAGGYRFLNIALQFAADEHDLAWAQSVINANPGLPTILTTHALLNTTGYQEAYRPINDCFVRNNPQIVMTLNGHINGAFRQTETNIAGQPVQQMLVDYQSTVLPGAPFKGGGYLRTMEFDVDAKVVRVESYSPVADAFLTDDANRFSLPLDLPARFAEIDLPGVRHTVAFQQGVAGYAGTRDTYLSAAEPTTSSATAAGLWVDGDASDASGSQPRQALLRFDGILGGAGIPSGALIESATLALRTGTTPQSHSSDPMTMHRMLTSWSDGSTWLSTGGIAADGTEAILGGNSTFVTAINGGPLSFDVTESLHAWQSGAPNLGWAFLPGGTDGWRFESSEAARIADRPALEVTYVTRAVSGEVIVDVTGGTKSQAAAGCPEIVGGATVRKRGAGDVLFDGPNSHTGRTIVEQGRLVIARGATLRLSTVSAVAGGAVALAGGVEATVAGLDLTRGGLIDVADGRVTVTSGPASEAVAAAIRSGRADGQWTGGSGITSTAAAAAGASPRAVGWFEPGDGSTTIAYAAAGDANLDWTLDILDAATFLAAGRFDTGLPARWQDGDFGSDGLVDVLDAADFIATGLFDAGQYHTPGLPSVAAVPEPVSSVVLVLATGAIGIAYGKLGRGRLDLTRRQPTRPRDRRLHGRC
jgi:autotransporter-associated beta strand protein